MKGFVESVRHQLLLPCGLDGNDNLTKDIAGDAAVLTCGCLISESFSESLTADGKILQCPVCLKKNVKFLAPVVPLRRLFLEVEKFDKIGKMRLKDATKVKKKIKKKSLKTGDDIVTLPSVDNFTKTLDINADVGISTGFDETYFHPEVYNPDNEDMEFNKENKMSLLSLLRNTALRIKEEEDEIDDSAILQGDESGVDNAEFDGISSSTNTDTDKSNITRVLYNERAQQKKNTKLRNHGNKVSTNSNNGNNKIHLSENFSISESLDDLDTKSSSSRNPSVKVNSITNFLVDDKSESHSSIVHKNQLQQQHSDTASASPTTSSSSPIIIPNRHNSITSYTNFSSSYSPSRCSPMSKHFTNSLSSKEPDFQKEILFSTNFPFYKKKFQYASTNGQTSKMKSLLLKRNDYVGSSIAWNTSKYALIEEKKWWVFTINFDDNFKPSLLYCGKNNNTYGPDMDDLKLIDVNNTASNRDDVSYVLGDKKTRELVEKGNLIFEYCAISENYLIVCGKRIIKIYDLAQRGRLIYTKNIGLPIRCIDISNDERLVACGLTGKDKATGTEGSLVMILNINDKSMISTSLILLNYKDPINNVKFSHDRRLLAVSTALESRFMVINVQKPLEPRLVMKAARKLQSEYETEGITDVSFFGDEEQYLVVTAVAFNSPPLILDTLISTLKESHAVAHPKLMVKLEEVGSNIHRCVTSPRNDAVALLNKKGTVFVAQMNKNFEGTRVVVAEHVMSATKKSEAASIRFSRDGYRLYIVDRKGILYVEDFANSSSSSSLSNCKPVFA